MLPIIPPMMAPVVLWEGFVDEVAGFVEAGLVEEFFAGGNQSKHEGYVIGTNILLVKCVTCRSAATPVVIFGLYSLLHGQQDTAANL